MQAGNIAGGSSHIAIFDPIVTADQSYSSPIGSGVGAMAINWVSISVTKFAPHRITSHAVLTAVITNRILNFDHIQNFMLKCPTAATAPRRPGEAF